MIAQQIESSTIDGHWPILTSGNARSVFLKTKVNWPMLVSTKESVVSLLPGEGVSRTGPLNRGFLRGSRGQYGIVASESTAESTSEGIWQMFSPSHESLWPTVSTTKTLASTKRRDWQPVARRTWMPLVLPPVCPVMAVHLPGEGVSRMGPLNRGYLPGKGLPDMEEDEYRELMAGSLFGGGPPPNGDGIVCPRGCGKSYVQRSSLERHMTTSYKLSKSQAKSAVDLIVADNSCDAKFDERRTCPERGCSSKFSFVQNLIDHLTSHGRVVTAEELLSIPDSSIREHLEEKIDCTLCQKYSTERKSHLLAHLESQHQLDSSQALKIAREAIAVNPVPTGSDRPSLSVDDNLPPLPLSGDEGGMSSDSFMENSPVKNKSLPSAKRKSYQMPSTPARRDLNLCESDSDDEFTDILADTRKRMKAWPRQESSTVDFSEPSTSRLPEERWVSSGIASLPPANKAPSVKSKKTLSLKAKPSCKASCKCSICGIEFGTNWGAKRHINLKHFGEERKRAVEGLTQVKFECPSCGKVVSNLQRHKQFCKPRVTPLPVPDIITEEAPSLFHPGGLNLLAAWDKWIKRQNLKEDSTAVLYRRKLVEIITFWETDIAGFKADSLLFPLENRVMFPAITGYVESSDTPGSKLTAVKTYQYAVRLVLSIFERRYTADTRYGTEKYMFVAEATRHRSEAKYSIKGHNKAAKEKTQRAVAERERDEDDWCYHPDKLLKATTLILSDQTIKNVVENLKQLSAEAVEEKYTEIYLRKILCLILLVSCNGVRPHVVGNMTLYELKNPTGGHDGATVISVSNHKTLHLHGPVNLVIAFPGLYVAVLKFVLAFR